MNPKEYLMQYRAAMQHMHALSEHISELRAVCEQLRTEDGESIRLDAAVAQLVDTGAEMAQQIAELEKLAAEICDVISRIQRADHRTLLTLVYIDGMTLVEAADAMRYSYRQTTRLHGHALQEASRIIAQNANSGDSSAV